MPTLENLFWLNIYANKITILILIENNRVMPPSQPTQTKILDSKSWIFSLQHFTRQNSLGRFKKSTQQENVNQIQYVGASTFDKWFALRSINIKNMRWNTIVDMIMSMPVVNSFIQFNQFFLPKALVIAYFDGSIDYCPWEKKSQYYSNQIKAGKQRRKSSSLTKQQQAIKSPGYVNFIDDQTDNIQQAFMLQTICFLHKRNDFIYALNFKGQLKIFKVEKSQNKLELIMRFRFQYKITKALYLPHQQDQINECINVAICFQNISTPYIFNLSASTTKQQIMTRLKAIDQMYQKQGPQFFSNNVKLIEFDCSSKQIITCTQKNQINIFTLDQVESPQKDRIKIPLIEKTFSLKTQINDLSVKQNRLLIVCSNSLCFYDLKGQIIQKQGERLKQSLHFGKIVGLTPDNGKDLLLIKKKSNYLDPSTKSSTTLHLFTGK